MVLVFSILLCVAALAYNRAETRHYFEEELVLESQPARLGALAGVELSNQSQPEEAPADGAVKIPIFIYHSVRPYIPNESKLQDAYDVTPALLEQELAYLNDNGYTTISMDVFVDYVKNGIPPGIKPVVLGFDDGWQNQYTYAYPLLKKYDDTAIFFIYTGVLGKKHFLTWDEVKEMDQNGMTIESHTVTHPLLKSLTPAALRYEMVESKKEIEGELGHSVDHFASPFGSTSALIQNTAKESGYLTARTTYKGVYHTEADLLKLRGILVSDSLQDFIDTLKK